MDVVYYIRPTLKNFELLLKDIPNKEMLKKFRPKYRNYHIFLNSTCSTACLNVLAQKGGKDVVDRINSFTELHLDFFARDQGVFHFNKGPLQMFRCFPNKKDNLVREY